MYLQGPNDRTEWHKRPIFVILRSHHSFLNVSLNLTQETFKPMPQSLSNGLASTSVCLPVAGNNILGGVARTCVVDT